MKTPIPDIGFFEPDPERHFSTEGNLEFDWALIEGICDASGIDIEEFRDTEGESVSSLIHQWYAEHRARGGAPDPVMENIIIEAKLEESFGSIRRKSGMGEED
jgi:hypothetical protein